MTSNFFVENVWENNVSVTQVGKFSIALYPQENFLKATYNLNLDGKLIIENKPLDFCKGYADGMLTTLTEKKMLEDKNGKT